MLVPFRFHLKGPPLVFWTMLSTRLLNPMDNKIIDQWISLRTFFSSLSLGVFLWKVKHAVFFLQLGSRYIEFDFDFKKNYYIYRVVILTLKTFFFHKGENQKCCLKAGKMPCRSSGVWSKYTQTHIEKSVQR